MVSALLLAAALTGTMTVSDDPHPPAVTVGAGAQGMLLTGPAGTALYTYDGDAEGSHCTGDCLNAWPLLPAIASDKPVGDWAPSRRLGVPVHWTYKGMPVYTYTGDRTPNVAAGDGLGGVWHAMRFGGPTPKVPVPPAARVAWIDADFVLTDSRGFTLYAFARDGRTPACHAECLEVWPPLLAPALARPIGRWTPVDRPDGVRQWAYRGRLLYTFSEDLAPGDRHGADAGGVWKAVTVSRRDAVPGRARPSNSAESER